MPALPTSVQVVAAQSALGDTMFQTACVFGAAFLGPVVSLVLILFVLRRYGKGSGPLFRIEHIGSLAGLPAGCVPAADGPSSAAAMPAPMELVEEAVPVGEPFEIGPTFQEEQQARAALTRAQEQGVLQQFFEENVQLQLQIASAPPEE